MKRYWFYTVAGLALLTGSALAQTATKPGGETMQAPAAGAEGGEHKLPPGGAGAKTAPDGGAKLPGATGGMASPGMKPNAAAAPQPGQRQNGENAGTEPQPAAEGAPGTKPAAEGQSQPGQKAGANQPPAAGSAKAAGTAHAAPKLTPDQTTRVKTVFRDVHVQPVHVDFDVNVGVAVPRTVVLAPVPPDVVTIVPGYEGFRFFAVPGELVIVDPVTFEIVDVLPI